MTPKDKAISLIESFKKHVNNLTGNSIHSSMDGSSYDPDEELINAKACAKICCLEIIAAIDENGVHASKHFATVKEYYNNVLKEIDLL